MSMSEADFIENVQREMTASGSLPVVLEEPEIKRLIQNEAEFFYREYGPAVESTKYVVTKASINNAQFKASRRLDLPDCVISVVKFQEINGVGRLGNIDRDFAEDRLMASEIFLSSFHGDDLVMRTAQYQYFDLAKAFFLEQIAYDFNINTKRLTVKGRDPKFDLYIEALVKIPLEDLFGDPYFLKYITGKAKIALGRMLSTYPFPMPGGVPINADMIRDEGKEEVDWILERIDSENTVDWFLQYH